MTRIKFSLLAIALTIGVGGAVAQVFQHEPESLNPNSLKFDCETTMTPTCRSQTGGIMWLADSDSQVPSTNAAYDRQYRD